MEKTYVLFVKYEKSVKDVDNPGWHLFVYKPAVLSNDYDEINAKYLRMKEAGEDVYFTELIGI